MKKKSFENLTIVSVTGSTDYIQGSIYAIQRSCQELKGAKGLLIAPILPAGIILPENIEHRVIKPFGYMEYNIFILYQLEYFIETDYCLIVQHDGWVVNGKNWREEFWEYDYIGAPIPFYGFYDESMTYHQICSYSTEVASYKGVHELQNGGFSFRSKKLLAAPRNLNLMYQVDIPKQELNAEAKIEWKTYGHHEDNFLTGKYRERLTNEGFKFAPPEVAHYFSLEDIKLHHLRGIPYEDTLGIHFNGNVYLTGENKAEIKITHKKFTSEQELFDYALTKRLDVWLLRRLNYHVHLNVTN